jgi:FkbM family methyltransferase
MHACLEISPRARAASAARCRRAVRGAALDSVGGHTHAEEQRMILSGRIAGILRHLSRRLQPWTARAPVTLKSEERSTHGASRACHRKSDALDEPAAIEALLRQHLRDGMNCVDVGAHIGGLTALLTSLSQRGKHLAIEPVPFNAQWLKDTYPQVEVVECAVADTPGRATVFRGERAFEVDVRRLDDVVPSARTIKLLKLAADGGELDAFRGAPRILRRDRPLILFECALRGANAFQQSAAELYAFLVRHRYTIYTPVDLVTGHGPLDDNSFERAVRFPFRAFHFVGLPEDPRPATDRAPSSSVYARVAAARAACGTSRAPATTARAPVVQRALREEDGSPSASCFPYA